MIPQEIKLAELSDDEARRLNDFLNANHAELMPEDPPSPLEDALRRWRNPSQKEWSKTFWMRDALNNVVGYAVADWDKDDKQNPDKAWMFVVIAPQHRRQGLGSLLLRHLLEACHKDGKRQLFVGSNDRVPAGKFFVERFGAKFGQHDHTNQLLFTDLNRDYVARALQDAPTDKFEIGWFNNAYPRDEHELETICRLIEVMNTAPRGELEFNDWQSKPEDLIDEETRAKVAGTEWWFLYVKERSTGKYAGFTQTGFHPSRPLVVSQWGTGVLPEYRGHGLGAWIKAAMIDRILKERPSVDRIRTGNADSNAPMLKINHALGFKPFISRIEWQLEVERALELLKAKTG